MKVVITMGTKITEDIINNLEKLPYELQKKVKAFIDALLISMPKGVSGKNLIEFAGKLSDEDAEEMMSVINEGCEKIDESNW